MYQVSWIRDHQDPHVIMYRVSWIMDHGSWIIRSSCHHVNMYQAISLYFLCHIVIRLKFLKGGVNKISCKNFLQISKCLCKLLHSARILVKRGGMGVAGSKMLLLLFVYPKLFRLTHLLSFASLFVGLCGL